MKKTLIAAIAVGGLCFVWGCVNVKAPERINVGGGPSPQKVDSSRVPHTATHAEAQAELTKAYDQIRYLEHQNRRLRDKYDGAKKDKEEYKQKYKQLKDRYDD